MLVKIFPRPHGVNTKGSWVVMHISVPSSRRDPVGASSCSYGMGFDAQLLRLPTPEAWVQVFREVVMALHICCLAHLLQGLSATVLMTANWRVGEVAEAISNVFDLLDDLIIAGLLSNASKAFDAVVTSEGGCCWCRPVRIWP